MARWFRWLTQHGLLPGLGLLVLSVIVIGQDIVTLRARKPEEQEKPPPTAPAPVPEWEEPVPVPIEEVEHGAWDGSWVVLRGVVTPDGANGLNWVGISADGRQMRVSLEFHKRDFRRCRAGQVITVEGYRRGSAGGLVELVECRFLDRPPADP
jgi:hypothetical protein